MKCLGREFLFFGFLGSVFTGFDLALKQQNYDKNIKQSQVLIILSNFLTAEDLTLQKKDQSFQAIYSQKVNIAWLILSLELGIVWITIVKEDPN